MTFPYTLELQLLMPCELLYLLSVYFERLFLNRNEKYTFCCRGSPQLL